MLPVNLYVATKGRKVSLDLKTPLSCAGIFDLQILAIFDALCDVCDIRIADVNRTLF
ncbi:hypothetical protein [Streptosporangium sp. NPDC051022]|uniref:hypothetical protein n=1 Tax=Streptosporangium sp. NPDC051022 TaxID=3155752 RepID=UPI0034183C93